MDKTKITTPLTLDPSVKSGLEQLDAALRRKGIKIDGRKSSASAVANILLREALKDEKAAIAKLAQAEYPHPRPTAGAPGREPERDRTTWAYIPH